MGGQNPTQLRLRNTPMNIYPLGGSRGRVDEWESEEVCETMGVETSDCWDLRLKYLKKKGRTRKNKAIEDLKRFAKAIYACFNGALTVFFSLQNSFLFHCSF